MEHKISNGIISVTVSSRGGEIKEISTIDGVQYLWRGSMDYWPGSAPHLFPFIGRLFEGRYIYDGVSYPLSIHGFLKDCELSLESKTQDSLVLRLEANKQTLACYPFDFVLKVSYLLEDNRVRLGFEINNLDEKEMPFAIGGHPGFNVPLEENLAFDDYYLEFDEFCSPLRTQPTETNLLNGMFEDFSIEDGRRLYLKHDLFDQDAIILKDTASGVILKSDKGSRAVHVSFVGFPYIGFWHTVKSDAPFVCIEPWTALQGYEDKVEEIDSNDDMIRLGKGETYANEIIITIIE